MNKKINSVFMLIIFLITLNFIIFIRVNRIHELHNRIANCENQIQRTNNKIDRLIDKLTEENDIYTNADVQIKNIDKQNLQCELYYEVVPKILTGDTKVYLDFGDNLVELDKNNSTFTKTLTLDIKRDYSPILMIKNGDDIKTQAVRTLYVSDFIDKVFPRIDPQFDIGTTYDGDNLKIDGLLTLFIDYPNRETFFTDMKYVVLQGKTNKLIKKLKLPINKNQKKVDVFDIDESYKLDKGQNLKYMLVANTNDGLTYELVFYDYILTINDDINNKQPEPAMFEKYDLKILNSDGVVIYREIVE